MGADMTSAGTTGNGAASSRALPPQTVMGLLDYLTTHSLDEDYAQASARRGAQEGKPVRPGAAALVVMLLFGVLVTIAGIRTAHNAPVSQTNHAQLVSQIKDRGAEVDARRRRIQALEVDIAALQSSYTRASVEGQQLSARLSRLGVWAGSVPVHGPGLRIVVDDAPNASSSDERVGAPDLQVLVNGLWQSGAEAVAVNGHRLDSLSAIRTAGAAITVNFRSLSRPYVVTAIGNPNQLPARFADTAGGSTWFDLKAAFGLRFQMTTEESLTLPAARRLTLHSATTPEPPR